MIKHALAVALLGTGIGLIDHAPVHAAPSLSGVAASAIRTADDTVIRVGGRCLEWPPAVVIAPVFWQLLTDDEIDTHCRRLYRDDDDQQTYDERNGPSYKDDGSAQSKDPKGRSLR
jgi:hypothetical protein